MSAAPDDSGSLTQSMEDYLEEIYDQTSAHRVARVRDIASSLEVSMSSVTGALKKLAQKNLINYDKYQYITLTAEGMARAAEIKGRHRILAQFLQEALDLDAERAENNACRMEHALDREVIARFLTALEFMETNPDVGREWSRRFREFRRGKEAQAPAGHAPLEKDLGDFGKGEAAVITRIEDARSGDARIAELGLLPGTPVVVKAVDAKAGVLTLSANGRTVDLARDEAKGIHARRVTPQKNKPRTIHNKKTKINN